MDLDEYIARRDEITSYIYRVVLALIIPFSQFWIRSDRVSWAGLMRILYEAVENARYDAARVAREFYDAKRIEHVGETRDVFLSTYSFDQFLESMEPIRQRVERRELTGNELANEIANISVKEVEGGARRTLIRAIESDPIEPRWARYDPEPPTCAFCTMLISRGPVYLSARSAGFGGENQQAMEILEREGSRAILKLMTRFHDGCTCVVIPVFDEDNWEGREQYEAAERLWREATKGYRGLDALNALRRSISEQRRTDKTALPKAA